MTTTQFPLFLLMFVAGTGIPVMASLNAGLGGKLGHPLLAVLILCIVASLTTAVLLVSTNSIALPVFSTPDLIYCAAGILFVFYVASITYATPHIGLGNAIFLVLLGQITSSVVIGHYGLFGNDISPITPKNAFGITTIGIGVFVTVGDSITLRL